MLNKPDSRGGARGFALLEVLVAIVIMSVGVLAMAGLQTAGVRAVHVSNLRTQVTQLSNDIMDRMRANPAAVAAGNYAMTSSATPGDPACIGTSCSTTSLAQTDEYEWKEALGNTLPSGAGIVCVDSTPEDGTPAAPACDGLPGSAFAIKIWVDDAKDPNNLKRFVTSFLP
jgi:type IV pilus assembly protein PilV